ncbi:MAG: hypothetical protein LBR80_13015 [Deltaproteobacteria bacterium]|nr:hypothetical protein [Deltaproteobacteria bacterium]
MLHPVLLAAAAVAALAITAGVLGGRALANGPPESLRRAAEGGDIESRLALGLQLMMHGTTADDRREGFTHLVDAALQGSPEAQASLGAAYLSGRGTLPDLGLAFMWLGRAAAQGQGEAAKILNLLDSVV